MFHCFIIMLHVSLEHMPFTMLEQTNISQGVSLYKGASHLVLSAMNFTSIIQYLLLVLLIAFTLVNIYSFTIGRKKRKSASHNYQEILRKLEQQAFNYMKKHKLKFVEKRGYITDSGEGILLTFDFDHQKVGITLSEEIHVFDFSEFITCERTYDTLNNGKITNVEVNVKTTRGDITLLFGSKPRKPKSYLGGFLLSDSQEFCDYLMESCHKSQPLDSSESE